MSHKKPFTLYTHKSGPNGWKVAMLLEELGLEYESVYLDFSVGEHKKPPYTDLNPNGRTPTLVDHTNGDFTLWESCAILQYLVDKHDKEGKFALNNDNDKYTQLQWLLFQASGQGPYFGQAAWFKSLHPEKIPSAIERYETEMKRVVGVLESVLRKQDWLVGGKFGVADLSFVTWHVGGLRRTLPDWDVARAAPHVDAWVRRMLARPAIAKVWAERNVRAAEFFAGNHK
ncbi:glutathione S-transferase [Gloeophyllum trabeum ATCC 11539]|uniref:glutathione transferase n=1 Tax=Gloeophyllum trabeum (strain ATCC 11539 / FP-39264 / Madison 617) TaxID=670483 RepID=S7Q2L7_GLOTA|nr:glutathione S-transferase [Gloeophyllum trabeum ATCC 11539]EPQ54236.1 glutathione S-transferase [Gloeophyllum trabeum ATCC 11539]